MALVNGFTPRDTAARLEIIRAIRTGAVPDAGDGYAAACRRLFVSGPPLHAEERNGLPLVSILICTFNRACWLAEAISSAGAQSWNCEVIVVDDGSTDDTEAILARTPGVHALRHASNLGKPRALETGLAACRGEALLVLDDDDILLPGAVRTLAEALFADESLAAVLGDTVVFDSETRDFLDYRTASRLGPDMSRQAALTLVPGLPGATLVRMSTQWQLEPFSPTLVRGQDMDHYLRLTALGPLQAVGVPTLLYRRHDGLRGSAQSQWKKHEDPADHRRRFLSYVQPVFRERWRVDRHPRDEGFAWALGLLERDLPGLAAEELAKWPGPDTAFEAWVRNRAGCAPLAQAAAGAPPLVILDDGDDGALLHLLATLRPTGPVEVLLPRPHDTVGVAQLFWPGVYRVESHLRPRQGRVCLRSSADPKWAPPEVDGGWLPRVCPSEAALCLSALLGWTPPSRARALRSQRFSAFTARCLETQNPDRPRAFAAVADVLQSAPTWPPSRLRAAALCDEAGLADDARALRA